MAIAATAVWEVRSLGNDTNGGAFNSAASGTDFSQSNSKRSSGDVTNISATDVVANGTTTLTSATMNGDASMVGNIIYLQGGSGTLAATRREITAFTSNSGGITTFVVDVLVASGTGITMNIGGAVASWGIAAGFKTAGNRVWIKNDGAYVMSSASSNVANGKIAENTGGVSAAIPAIWEGYLSTRGDLGTRPTLTASGSGVNQAMFTITSNFCVLKNLIFVTSNGAGISSGSNSIPLCFRVKAQTGSSTSFSILSGVYISCEATGTVGFNANSSDCTFIDCVAHGCTTMGFSNSSGTGQTYIRCLAYNNTGATTDGFVCGTRGAWINCVAYGNGRDGFRMSSAVGAQIINCISEGNTGWGFGTAATSRPESSLINCAAYNNTAGNFDSSNVGFVMGSITGASTFFTNAGSADFSLNSSAGAALKGAAYPSVTADGLSTSHLDIGIVQSLSVIVAGLFLRTLMRVGL